MLQHADVLLHAGQGHLERVGELGDRGVFPREPFKNATPCRIGQSGKGRVDVLCMKLNHMVQYRVSNGPVKRAGPAVRPCARALHDYARVLYSHTPMTTVHPLPAIDPRPLPVRSVAPRSATVRP